MALGIMVLALALADAPVVDAPASTPGDVPVEIGENLVRYAIKGDTTSELISQMAKLGPYDEGEGRRFQGFTEWSVQWNYQMASQPGGNCSLGDLKIDLKVQMTLPEWEPKRHADQLLVQEWPRYLAKLTEHEMGHRANGVRAAFAVRDAITAIAPMADCGQLASAVNAAGNAAIAQLKDADAEYDRETEHGARQGVRLP
ncbi:DUF922 domain-containing protein [Pseudoluteimonas lycopersici]|uniref:DUF922 domain-containing protein n=1 Tax=Pseudoluteimonas lycopersici TaxID=1324796 RepID=A0A516V505_9GAMM|nr:DUF922 domain-containing protein [Lysobacter lycopersici]QDQ73571.1 DUF922 domain-containing protein [Lysobacter lycopersici]